MNNLTILVDGGWHMMRNVFHFEKGFRTSNSDAIKQATAQEFEETLARSFIKILNQFPFADNIILMTEGGSWRKSITIPKHLQQLEITYKGNRVKREEVDWSYVYKAYANFSDGVAKAGITHSVVPQAEGDDLIWYWSRRLNKMGINTLIWSLDCDLKQLVQVDGNAFTVWYNEKNGLVLPTKCEWPKDVLEAMQHPPFQSEVLTKLISRVKNCTYINPDSIVINKILCGDAGDNIKPIVQYQKNGRNYGFANRDYEAAVKDLKLYNMSDLLFEDCKLPSYICNIKRFKPYNFTEQLVTEMLHYNTKLVWLNESTVPKKLVEKMDQIEYLHPDVAQIRNNYRTIMGKNETIEDIFSGISV